MKTAVLHRLTTLLLICLALVLAACAGPSTKDDDNDDSGDDQNTESGGVPGLSLSSQCGAMNNGLLENPANAVRAELVDVTPVRPDTVIVRPSNGTGGEEVIKFQSVTSDGVETRLYNNGFEVLASATSRGAYLVRAGDNCPVTINGGQGVLGQLFQLNGAGITEQLLAAGAVVPVADSCGGEQLVSCYDSIEVIEEFSTSVIDDFLWKPVSESDGKLVVLVNPYNATVRVTGAVTETLRNVGPGNGRGTQARANRPGCAFGNNVRVEVFDSQGRRMKVKGTDTPYVTVPRGCSRFEFVL